MSQLDIEIRNRTECCCAIHLAKSCASFRDTVLPEPEWKIHFDGWCLSCASRPCTEKIHGKKTRGHDQCTTQSSGENTKADHHHDRKSSGMISIFFTPLQSTPNSFDDVHAFLHVAMSVIAFRIHSFSNFDRRGFFFIYPFKMLARGFEPRYQKSAGEVVG